ncbi:Crp/Fnr family transcriptional regulator [bacterium]|nr:MAG: Crp/Fnr family transcriptional regulator [bacterium]
MKQTLKSAAKADYLKDVPLFLSLNAKQRLLIQSVCKNATFSAGMVIINQDDLSFDLYVVLSGSVKVSLFDQNGREMILDTIKEGGFFGELSLFDKKPRSATVTALSQCGVLILKREDLIHVAQKDFTLVTNFLHVMAERLRKADGRIETLAFMDVCGRVARTLLDLSTKEGKQLPDGSITLKRPTHQDIAHQIGASREAVTKALISLTARNVIKVSGRSITISPKQFDVQ